MKNITIDERIAKLDEERERLYNIKDVIKVLEREQQWLMACKRDENGEYIKDENGNNVMGIPEKDDWGYGKYMIYEEIKQYLLK